jgi:tripartite-type tricarboxylate transporter receptor subunit TctC
LEILRDVEIREMSAFGAALALASVTLFSTAALAQAFPAKPIRIVVAGAAGGSPDILIRLMSPVLTEALGQPIVVDNRAGASGRIGVEVAAKAAPDGHTLLMLTSSNACVEVLSRNPRYEIARDFSPVSLVGTVTSVLLVTPSVPATSVRELVALAKSRPGALKHGSSGPGSSSHLPAELFKIRTGTNILHVPYKSASPALVGLMAGEIDVIFNPITSSMAMIKAGKLRALGVTSRKRTALALDLPTISETIPDFEFLLWQSLMAPAKTPPDILSKLNSVVIKVLNSPAVQDGMAAIGNEPRGTSRPELAAYVNDYMKQIRDIVRTAGVKLED